MSVCDGRQFSVTLSWVQLAQTSLSIKLEVENVEQILYVGFDHDHSMRPPEHGRYLRTLSGGAVDGR